MESVLVEAVVGKVCEMAVQQVRNEVALLVNFAQDFEWLKKSLQLLNSILSEADATRKESLITWLQNVRDISCEAEDILQECAVESMYGNLTQSSCTLSCNELILRHKMGRRIDKVKARMNSILQMGNQLIPISNVVAEAASSSTSAQVKKSSLLPRDSHPVGIEPKIQHMVGLLDNPQIQVVAVVGMGGLGKTYLLQHVYDTAKSRFEISIWLSISKKYSVRYLQYDIASHLNLKQEIVDSGVTEERAAELINGRLRGKQCLVVLDDLWTASTEDSLIQKLGLPAHNDCKVIVSTRNREVGENNRAVIYNMDCLSKEDSWKLFCFYGFPDCEGNKPPQHLEQVAREIVEQCANSPLAIKATAASLASTKLLGKWSVKLGHLKRALRPNGDPVMDVLKLSYDSLPAHLKECFAYLSFFPEDEKIKCEYLINLWIGEGFIPPGEDQWHLGWDCLDQLHSLCLVEVWEDISARKYCKVHDLLLDLCFPYIGDTATLGPILRQKFNFINNLLFF
ncbi:hypothetical protein KI387_023077 [Taxus chinensis]|uniref:Disease resistance protein n=1 Tax=Taxus chinensis TaxID=29808 RepID=A0AA38LAK9_TAXCH|nr:hypothetical protein KI387_023077 [Taxus chinensis]